MEDLENSGTKPLNFGTSGYEQGLIGVAPLEWLWLRSTACQGLLVGLLGFRIIAIINNNKRKPYLSCLSPAGNDGLGMDPHVDELLRLSDELWGEDCHAGRPVTHLVILGETDKVGKLVKTNSYCQNLFFNSPPRPTVGFFFIIIFVQYYSVICRLSDRTVGEVSGCRDTNH